MVVNNDGTQTYAGGDQTVTGLALDETVTWRGATLPTGSADAPPQTAIFLLTAQDGTNPPGVYEQTNASRSTPTWTLRSLSLPVASLANGDVFYYNSNAPLRLGIGATDEVLRVASGLPDWQAPLKSRGFFTAMFKADTQSSVAIYSMPNFGAYQDTAGSWLSMTHADPNRNEMTIDQAITITRIMANVDLAGWTGGSANLDVMDDGSDVATLAVPATSNNQVLSSVLSVDIAALSEINLKLDPAGFDDASITDVRAIVNYEYQEVF